MKKLIPLILIVSIVLCMIAPASAENTIKEYKSETLETSSSQEQGQEIPFKLFGSTEQGMLYWNISEDPVQGNATVEDLPGAATIYSGNTYYFNLQVTDDIYLKTAELYIKPSGSSSYSCVDRCTVSGYFRFHNFSYTFDEVGSFSYYWYVTYANSSGTATGEDQTLHTTTVTVHELNSMDIDLTSYNGTYDGKAHAPTISVNGPSSYTIYYSTTTELRYSNCRTSGSTTKPTRTNPGSTKVYYYVLDGTGIYYSYYGSLYINIKPSVSTTSYSGTYDGNSHTASISVSSGAKLYYSTSTSLSYSNYSSSGVTSVPSRTVSGTSTVYYIAVPNSDASSSSCTTGSTSIDIRPKVTATSYNGIANGSAHSPTISATGGATLYYSTTSSLSYSNYSSSGSTIMPSRTQAGTTTVYYIAVPNSNPTSTTCTAGKTVITLEDPKSYTVSYNANGGTGAPSSQIKTEGTALTLSSTKPTKTYTITYNANGGSVSSSSNQVNCTFKNWNTAANGSGTSYNSGGQYKEDASVTLYAQWTNPTAGTFPTSTRSGYIFNGWFTSSSGGSQVTSATTITGNMTVYAHWTQNPVASYTVSYNANGGTGAPASQTKTQGVALTLSSTKPTKTYTITYNANNGSVSTSSKQVNCTFNNWNTVANGSGTSYNSGGQYKEDAAVTLYAQWTNPTAGTLAAPTRSGYSFDGWYTSSSGGSQVTSSTTITGNMTVYAHWTQNPVASYTVSYNANGGTGAPASQTKTQGVALTLSSTKPTKSYTITYNANGGSVSSSSKQVNCTFKNWNTVANGSGTSYNSGGQYKEDASVTLYAQWIPPVAGELTMPTLLGYTFDGWYTSATDGDQITNDNVITDDITIYAHWSHTHSYTSIVTPPTCVAQGYSTHVCTCGDMYKDSNTSAIGHEYINGKCVRCGAIEFNRNKKFAPVKCNDEQLCPSRRFTDVPSRGNWAHEGIDYCVSNNLMNGVSNNTFNPSGNVTRGQLVTILYRMAGEPHIEFKGIFSDVEDGVYWSNPIEWAATNGIVNGVGDNKFNPAGVTTREQIATIFYRYSKATAVTGSIDAFPDAADAHMYAVPALIWAVDAGIISGVRSNDITYLKPLAYATRAQIASIIMRFLESCASHTVAFNLNDEYDRTYMSVQISNGKQINEPIAPCRAGYAFDGWYIDKSFSAPFDFNSAIVSDVTLYAKWSPLENCISGGGTSVDVYSVLSLSIDKDNGNDYATAVVSAPENCALIVRFIDEEVYFSESYPANKSYISEDSLFAATAVREGTDMGEISVPITGSLPMYFVAEAILIDDEGNELCDPFTSINHSRRYELYEQKTIYDFSEEDTVLNFDDNDGNNFGVLADDVRSLSAQEITREDDFDGCYYITKPSSPIEIGDKIFISDGNRSYLFKAKSVSQIGNMIIVVPAKATDDVYGFSLSDFYKYIKVDMEYSATAESDSQTENDMSLMGINIKSIDENISAETSLSLNPISIETDHFKATGGVKGTIGAELVVRWDVILFGKDYIECDFNYSTDLTAKLNISGKIESDDSDKAKKEVRLGKLRIPFGVTGFDAFADIKAEIEWELSGGAELEGVIKSTHGFKYNTKDGGQRIDKKESSWSVNFAGHAEIRFGPAPSIGVEFLDGILQCEAECFFGLKAEADAIIPVAQGGSIKHNCNLCIDGTASFEVSVDVKFEYHLDRFEGTPIDWNIVDIKYKLFDFYCSIINSSDSMFGGDRHFGTGECPNKSYKTLFNVFDESNSLYKTNVRVSDKDTGNEIAVIDTESSIYLFNGNYLATATCNGHSITKSFSIADSPQRVVMSSTSCDGSISGLVKSGIDQTVIKDACITISRGNIVCATAKSNADGSYYLTLPEGTYTYTVTSPDYVTAYGVLSISDGETKHMETTMMAKNNNYAIMGGVHGTIRDATTGAPISGVNVSILPGVNNQTDKEPLNQYPIVTDTNGYYSSKTQSVLGVTFGLPAGNYTVVLDKPGYISTSFSIVIIGGMNIEFNGTIAPTSSENEYRVVLTWGKNPEDLDSHYIATTNSGLIDHVYYHHQDGDTANLDTDDTDSYGPETVFITEFEELLDGFCYYVHDFTNRELNSCTALSNSEAMVKIYRGSTLLATYYVPSNVDGTVWKVFSISRNGAIRAINEMSYEDSPESVGRN